MAAAPEVSHDEMNTHGEAPAITDYEGDDVTTEFETNERTLPPQREHDRTHETETEDDDGWIAAVRRLRRRAAASLGKPASPSSPAAWQPRGSDSFVKKVTARLSRAARMPVALPRHETKIIIRPRGGLNVAKTEARRLMSAIFAAAGVTMHESRIDTICTNPTQNIIVISTPDEGRARSYVQIRQLRIGNAEYETFAYVSAPDGTVKGIIRGIDTTETHQDLQNNIVNETNPLALEAHRIGNTTTVIVAFEGSKVPNSIKYGAMIVRCSLYRQHHEFCRCCGKLGHRADVCPNPETKVCLACGRREPEPNHEATCKPRCKLCNGAHATGATGCLNRFKVPHVVLQRRGAKEQQRKEAKQQPPQKTVETFPQLQSRVHAPVAAPRTKVGGSVKAPTSAAVGGAKTNRNGQAQPATGVTWAKVTAGATSRGNPALERELQDVRHENMHLRAQMERQEEIILALNRKLDLLLAGKIPQELPPRTPTVSRDSPQSPPSPPIRIPLEPEEVEETPESNNPTPENVAANCSDAPREEMDTDSEPTKKRRALKSKIREQQYVTNEEFRSFQDARAKQFETVNTRLSALEATQAGMSAKLANLDTRFTNMEQMMTTIYKKLTAKPQSIPLPEAQP